MATGYLKAGVDLDTLFMARVNAKIADVGYQVAGTDLSNIFEGIGAGTPIAATGFQKAGTDLANLFRNISEPLSGTVSVAAMTCAATTAVTAVAQYQLRADGNIFGTNGTNAVIDRGDWISPQTGMSLFEVQATQISGSFIGGNGVGLTWWPLSADVVWTRTQSVAGASSSAVFSITIRRIADSVVVAGPVNITLDATHTP